MGNPLEAVPQVGVVVLHQRVALPQQAPVGPATPPAVLHHLVGNLGRQPGRATWPGTSHSCPQFGLAARHLMSPIIPPVRPAPGFRHRAGRETSQVRNSLWI